MGLALLLQRVDHHPIVRLRTAAVGRKRMEIPALLQPTPAEAVLDIAFRARLLMMARGQTDIFALRSDPAVPLRAAERSTESTEDAAPQPAAVGA